MAAREYQASYRAAHGLELVLTAGSRGRYPFGAAPYPLETAVGPGESFLFVFERVPVSHHWKITAVE